MYYNDANGFVGIDIANPPNKLTVADGHITTYNNGVNVPNFGASMAQDFNTFSRPSSISFVQITDTYPEPGSILRMQSTGGDPMFYWNGLSLDGGINRYIVFKLRWVSGGTSWQGTTYYSTSSHGHAETYRQTYSGDLSGNWKIYVLDMWNLNQGGTDWMDNTITSIRCDWSNETGGIFELDWIAIGSDCPVPLLSLSSKSGDGFNSMMGNEITTSSPFSEWFESEEESTAGALIGLNEKTGYVRVWRIGDPFIGICSAHSGSLDHVNKNSGMPETEPSDHYIRVQMVGQADIRSEDIVEEGRRVMTPDGQVIGWRLPNGTVLIR